RPGGAEKSRRRRLQYQARRAASEDPLLEIAPPRAMERPSAQVGWLVPRASCRVAPLVPGARRGRNSRLSPLPGANARAGCASRPPAGARHRRGHPLSDTDPSAARLRRKGVERGEVSRGGAAREGAALPADPARHRYRRDRLRRRLYMRILRKDGSQVKRVIAILGGSTPFSAALVEAFRGSPACELRLFGQDRDALERMKRYAERRLEWTVLATSRLEEAVTGAAVVVNQIRFGGLEGRSRDEALADRFGLAADETLGPCGLSAALRVVPRIRELAAGLGLRCPDAWVLNLSNPLSVTTRAMIRAGAPRKCVGLCELPLTTFLETCRLMRVSPSDVEWDYAGLNHRGFSFRLRQRSEDVMARMPAMFAGVITYL